MPYMMAGQYVSQSQVVGLIASNPLTIVAGDLSEESQLLELRDAKHDGISRAGFGVSVI